MTQDHPTTGNRPPRTFSSWRSQTGQPARPAQAGPVVLLHGFASCARVMIPLERSLRRQLRRPVVRLPISPGAEDLRETTRRLDTALDDVLPYGTGRIDVVGHSMGGLVATMLLKRLDRGRRVRNVVTLGTPHGGTPLARAALWFFGGLSPALWQMRPGSELLEELADLPVPTGSQLTSIAGGRDRIVSAKRARVQPLAGHRNVVVDEATHVKLLMARESLRLVGGLLAEDTTTTRMDLAA